MRLVVFGWLGRFAEGREWVLVYNTGDEDAQGICLGLRKKKKVLGNFGIHVLRAPDDGGCHLSRSFNFDGIGISRGSSMGQQVLSSHAL
jgi:hypothetical protein